MALAITDVTLELELPEDVLELILRAIEISEGGIYLLLNIGYGQQLSNRPAKVLQPSNNLAKPGVVATLNCRRWSRHAVESALRLVRQEGNSWAARDRDMSERAVANSSILSLSAYTRVNCTLAPVSLAPGSFETRRYSKIVFETLSWAFSCLTTEAGTSPGSSESSASLPFWIVA